MDIKEESCFLEFCSEKERDTNDLIKKVKIETVTSSSDIKPEFEDSTSCSLNEEHHLMRFNETIKESETKIDIKEECWLEREDPYVNDDIKGETHEDFYSTKPQSLYKADVSSYTTDLFSSEDLGNDISFNMEKDSPECECDRKSQGQESVVTDIFSIETSVCSETSDDGKIVSLASSLKQSKLLQQRNSSEQNMKKQSCKSILGHKYRKSYKCDVSQKCSIYSYPERDRLIQNSEEANKFDTCDKVLNHLSLETCKLIDDGEKNKRNNFTKDVALLQCLKTHKLILEGLNPFKCNICNKAFTLLTDLKTHKLIHECIKPYKCNICNKIFTRSSSLKTHKLFHEGIKPHKCNICNKAFTQLSVLKRHKLVHEGIEPHKCNICNKAFTELSTLKRHTLIHEGIKPHKCNICNKAFTALSNMKTHKLVHEGIKPHKCNICNKAFTRLSHLKTHKLTHEGIKPNKCNICNKDFAVLSNLRRHKLLHEDIRPHKCNICNKAFTTLSYLKRHTLIHQDK